jgi:hypothetical protein
MVLDLKLLMWIGLPILLLYLIFGKRTLFVVIGMVLGVYIAKHYTFDMVEVMGWELFWESVEKGHINTKDIQEIILKSTTFHKSFLGGVIGGWIGHSLSGVFFGANTKSEDD